MKEKKLRYEIDPIKANLTVHRSMPTGGEAVLTLELDAGLRDVSRRLALMGLATHLQRAVTRGKANADPFDVIEAAYRDLKESGLAAFERKVPVPVPGGNGKPTKAQCIAALAVLKGTTPSVIKEKLKAVTDKDRVAAILNHADVLAKVAEMAAGADGVEL